MFEFLEKTVTFLLLFYTTQALVPLFFPPEEATSAVVGIGIQVVLYGAVLVLILLRWSEFVRGIRAVKSLVPLLLLVLASTAWSQYHSLSLRRGLILLVTTLFGVYFAVRFTRVQQFRILAFTFFVIQALSVIFALFLPQYGLDHERHLGVWQGAFYQKNELARIMVLAALVFLFSRDTLPRILRWSGCLASVALLVLSHSITSIAVFALTLACLPLIWLTRTKCTFAAPILIVAFLASVVVGSAFLKNKSEALALVHRRDNLTGRTLIWKAAIPEAARRPLLGYGYSAFWLRTIGASGNVVASIHFVPVHSHNGFLDIWLELGAFGFALFIASYFSQLRLAIQAVRYEPSSLDLWAVVFLLMLLFCNLAESPLLRENRILWVLYTANAVNLVLSRYAEPFASKVLINHDFTPLRSALQGRPSVGF